MPPPKILASVRPGNFIGSYVAPQARGEAKVAVLDVFEGKITNPATAALVGSDVRLFELMPTPGDERGNSSDEPLATIAIGKPVKEEDGHVGAEVSFVVGSEATSSHNNPVVEGRVQFEGLLKVLTSEEATGEAAVDRVHVRSGNVDVTNAELLGLGFSTTGGNAELLTLDLAEAA